MYRVGLISVLLVSSIVATDPEKAKVGKADQSPPPAAEQLKSLKKEYAAKGRELFKAFDWKKYQDLATEYASKGLDLAKKNPKDPIALEAALWAASIATVTPELDNVVDWLLQNHMDSDKLGQICPAMEASKSLRAESELRTVLERSPHKEVRGLACFALAEYLRNRVDYPKTTPPADADKLRGEAEALLKRPAAEYPDVKHYDEKLSAAVPSSLFELQHLGLGMIAPDVVGDDIESKPIKLSDYRGKVVLLDFWGNW